MIHRLLFWTKFPQKTLFWFLPLSICPLDPVRRELWPPLKGLYTVVTNTPWGRVLSLSHSVRTSLFPTQLILFCEKLLFASCCLGFQSCPNTKQWVTNILLFRSSHFHKHDALQEGTRRHFCCLSLSLSIQFVPYTQTISRWSFPILGCHQIHSQKQS